jgi:hypothetical protein
MLNFASWLHSFDAPYYEKKNKIVCFMASYYNADGESRSSLLQQCRRKYRSVLEVETHTTKMCPADLSGLLLADAILNYW